MNDKTFLDRVYDVETTAETRLLYDEWAETYDREVGESNYITPMRVARALAAYSRSLDAPILDYGCGTGLSGAALIQTGFTCIDGADLSSDMLQGARAKDLYRQVWLVDPDLPLGVSPGDYAAIVAVGVIGHGAAPPEVFDILLDALAPGALLGFSFNDHTLDDPSYTGRLDDAIEAKKAKVKFQEYGDHLPGQNMKSTVYILEKT